MGAGVPILCRDEREKSIDKGVREFETGSDQMRRFLPVEEGRRGGLHVLGLVQDCGRVSPPDL